MVDATLASGDCLGAVVEGVAVTDEKKWLSECDGEFWWFRSNSSRSGQAELDTDVLDLLCP